MTAPHLAPRTVGGITQRFLSPRLAQALAKHPLLVTLFPLLRHSLIYLAGSVVLGLGNFILVPLYTRHLTQSEFGAYALVEVSLLITVTVTQMGLGTTVLRWYAEIETAQRGEVLATSVCAVAIAAILGGGVLAVIFQGPLGARWLGASAGVSWVLLPLVFLRSLQGILFSSLQAAQRSLAYVSSAVLRLLALVAGGYWFVAVRSQGVPGVLCGWFLGDGVCVAALLAFCWPRVILRARMGTLWPMLRYGFPLVWSALMALLLDASGRFSLAHFESLSEVARYTVGIKIAGVLSMGFLQPFGNAWAGAAFPIAHRPNAPITYTKIMSYALMVAVLLGAITILFAPLLIRVFAGRAYSEVRELLPWLLLPVVFRLLEYWSSLPIYLKYKTHWLAPVATGTTALCAGLNTLLVPRWGALGAALAWSAALAASIALLTVLGRRYYALPFDLRTCGFAAAVWVLAIAVGQMTATLEAHAGAAASTVASTLLVLATVAYFLWDVRGSKTLFRGEGYAAD